MITCSEISTFFASLSGTVELGPGVLNEAFDNLIRYYYENNPVVLRKLEISQQDDMSITLAGQSDYLNVVDTPVTLSAHALSDGGARITLRYQLLEPGPKQANTWTFRHSFPTLPLVDKYDEPYEPVDIADDGTIINAGASQTTMTSLLESLELADAYFVVTTHSYQDTDFEVPMQPGLNYVSKLRPASLLGVLSYALKAESMLTLYGTIRPPRATEVIRPLLYEEKAWDFPDTPGIHLQADLGLDFTFAKALSFHGAQFRIYSPLHQDWLHDNPTYKPVHGYTGTLSIPSADLQLNLASVLQWGTDIAFLDAFCDGMTLGKLTQLLDLTGSDSLQGQLPASLSEALDTLDRLELTYLSLELELGDGLPQIRSVGVELGFPHLHWDIWKDRFTLASLSCRITVTNPFASPWVSKRSLMSKPGRPAIDLMVRGQLDIEGVLLNVVTRSREDWAVRAYMPQGETMPLGKLMNTWLPDVPCPSDLTIDQLTLGMKPGTSYDFGMTLAGQPVPWVIPIGACDLELSDAYLQFAWQKPGGMSGGFGGATSLAGQILYMNYRIPGDVELKAELQQLTMQDIVEAVLGAKADLPAGLDFTLSTANVLISKDGDNYLFQVAAFVENLGYCGLEIRKQPATGWGMVAGMALPDVRLSDVPGLKDLAALEKVVDLKDLSLFLATYDGAALQFPGLEKFGNPTLVGHHIPVAPGTGGLIAGVNVSASWQLDTRRKDMALLKQILGLNPEMDVTAQVSRIPSENSRLYLRFDTALNNGKDPFSGQLGFALVNGAASLFLAGRYDTRIQKQPVTFNVAMSIVKGGIFFSGSMLGTVQFDSVQLSNLALALGFNWGGIPTLGLAASLNISGWQSSIAVFFDSTDPSKSLLAGAISDLSLADIANGLAEGDIPKDIEDVLRGIEITGTRPFNIPYDDVAEALDECDLKATAAAFQTYGQVSLSASTDQVLQVVGTPGKRWSLTDMGYNLRHYQLERQGQYVQVSLNPQFYLAPASAQMGSLVFPQGYFITGTLNILGLKWTSHVEIRNDKGIAVSSELNKPLEIYDPGFFRLSDVEGESGPKLSMATFKQPDLEDKAFRNPHIYINGSLTMLGATSLAYVKGTTKGFEFQIDLQRCLSIPGNNVFSGSINGSFTLSGTFDTITNFNGGASFSLKIKGKMDLEKLIGIEGLPELSLDMAASGTVAMGYDGKKAYVKALGQFRFEGTQYTFQTTLQATNAEIANAGEWVMDRLEAVLKDLLDSGEKLVQALEDGWVVIEGGAEATANMLANGYNKSKAEALQAATDVYNLSADGVAAVGKGLDMTANDVGGFMKDVKGWGDDTVAKALQSGNFATQEVWDFMQNAYGWFKHVDIGHYDQAAFKWHGDASKRYHLDAKQHFDIKIAQWKPHVDEGKTIGVNQNTDLTPHVDLPHADFRPTPQQPHIDVNGINIEKGKYGGTTYSSPHADFKAGVGKKVGGKKFHLDAGHVDTQLKVNAPKVPTSHIDVGHVDVGASLDNPNKGDTEVKGRK